MQCQCNYRESPPWIHFANLPQHHTHMGFVPSAIVKSRALLFLWSVYERNSCLGVFGVKTPNLNMFVWCLCLLPALCILLAAYTMTDSCHLAFGPFVHSITWVALLKRSGGSFPCASRGRSQELSYEFCRHRKEENIIYTEVDLPSRGRPKRETRKKKEHWGLGRCRCFDFVSGGLERFVFFKHLQR